MTPFHLNKKTYHCQFIEYTPDGGERYRVGRDYPSYYTLKLKAKPDQNQNGILVTHDIYQEYPNRLHRIPDYKVFAKLNKYLSNARKAMRNDRANKMAGNIGVFSANVQKKWQKQNQVGH